MFLFFPDDFFTISLNVFDDFFSLMFGVLIFYISGSYDYDLDSHTTYVVYANFDFRFDTERQVFEKLFIAIFFFCSQSFCQKSAER